jgi:hypothetical protein
VDVVTEDAALAGGASDSDDPAALHYLPLALDAAPASAAAAPAGAPPQEAEAEGGEPPSKRAR